MAAAREDITIPTFTALIHCVNAFGDHNELIRGWLLLAAQLEKIGYANPLDAITTLFILHGSSRWDKTILEQIFLAMIPKESEDIAKKYTSLEDFKRKLANCIRATLAHSSSVNEATKELATLIANEDSADRFPISFNELVSRGADIDKLIFTALIHGSVNTFENLLKLYPDLQQKDVHDRTPLIYGCLRLLKNRILDPDLFQKIKLLLQYGADSHLRSTFTHPKNKVELALLLQDASKLTALAKRAELKKWVAADYQKAAQGLEVFYSRSVNSWINDIRKITNQIEQLCCECSFFLNKIKTSAERTSTLAESIRLFEALKKTYSNYKEYELRRSAAEFNPTFGKEATDIVTTLIAPLDLINHVYVTVHRTIINQQLTKFLNETQTIKNEIARLMRLSGVNFPFYVVEYRSISIDGEPINETREEHTFLSHLSEAEQILLTYEDRQVDEFDIDSTGTNIREYSTRYESETPLHLIARYGRSCIDVELAELIIHSYSEADIALLQTDPKLLPFICQNLSYEIRAFYARHGFSAVLEAAIEHRGSSLPLASIAMAEVGTSITSGNAAGSHGNRI